MQRLAVLRLVRAAVLLLLFLLALIPLLLRILSPSPHPARRGSSPTRPDVAFVGDSITAGGDWARAFPHLRVVNLGVDGDTSWDVLARLPALRASGARTYLVMVGINDILKGVPAAAIAARIDRLRVSLGRPPGTRVLIQSTLPCEEIRCGRAAVEQVDELNRLLRRRTPPDAYIDLSGAFRDQGGLPAAYSSDGLHLTPAGYRRWQQLLSPLLRGGSPPSV
jgi:lysophospholipase L1-like esterase